MRRALVLAAGLAILAGGPARGSAQETLSLPPEREKAATEAMSRLR